MKLLTRMLLCIVLFLLATQVSSNIINTGISYGSMLKILHLETNTWLHSHEIRIGRNNIYSVTGYQTDDLGSYWQLNEQYGGLSKTYNNKIKCGDTITLTSTILNYYLNIQQTVFGLTTQLLPLVHGVSTEQGDVAVDWIITCVHKQNGEEINFKDQIKLKHVTTGRYAMIQSGNIYTEYNCGRGCAILGQLEIFGVPDANSQATVFQLLPGMTFMPSELSLQ